MVGWPAQSSKQQAVSWETPKVNRAKTGKGPSKSWGLSEGYRSISREEGHSSNQHPPWFPNFPLYDLTGLQRRQGLSVMLPLNFREKFKTAKPCLDQNCRQTCLVSSLDFERSWSPALVGDVSQMYLELALTTEDRPLLRFLRRDLHQRKGARSLRILKICVWGLLLYVLCTVYKAEACRWQQRRVPSPSGGSKE